MFKEGLCTRRQRARGVVYLAAMLSMFCATLHAIELKRSGQEAVKLGHSVVELNGPWKFQPGDSPVANGQPVWAQPQFNDIAWNDMDLTTPAGSVDPFFGEEGFVPGWTERGFPGVTGFAWYRLKVRVQDPGEPLWLKMPSNVDDAYQVYANGKLIGELGHFDPDGVQVYFAHPRSFQLPPPADGVISLAIRFWLESDTAFMDPSVGGMHAPPVLGMKSTVQLLQSRDEDFALRSRAVSGGLVPLLFFLAVPVVLWAWLQNRSERAYLWLLLILLCYIAGAAVRDLCSADLLTSIPGDILREGLNALILPCWILFWWQWFALTRDRWIVDMAALLFAVDLLAVSSVQAPLYGDVVPLAWSTWLRPVHHMCGVFEGVMLVLILLKGFRRHRTEAFLATVPLLLVIFSSFSEALLARFGFQSNFTAFGLTVPIGALASWGLLLIIGALAIRRFLATHATQQREQQAIEAELEQASALQQSVLVSENARSAFFRVDTAYRPAQTVGGDFFQVISGPDGSLLVVLGDVSGKGVSAAMLVAVLVGAIRTRAEQSLDPFGMLRMLNSRLTGRSGGHFATCLAMHLRTDGTVCIANAGHLPPFMNGHEVANSGALPLGLLREAEFSSTIVRLSPKDRLTLMSDGVVEAMDQNRELLGFDRTRAMSRLSAHDIAEQAVRHGQQDDITVLTVDYAGIACEVLVG